MVAANPILLIHKRDGSIVQRFASETEAARALDLTSASLCRTIKKRTLQPGLCIIRAARQWSGREDFKPRAYNRPVFVARDGHVRWFPNVTAAALELGMSHDYMRARLADKKADRRGICARYALSTDDWPMLREDIESMLERGIEVEDPLSLGKPNRGGQELGENPE